MRASGRLILCCALAAVVASLPTRPAGAGDLRHGSRLGVSVGILGEPACSYLLGQVSCDVAPNWRFHAGAGGGSGGWILENSTWNTYGGGVRFLALPQKPISPMFGASVAYMKMKTGMFGVYTETEGYTYGGPSAGLDWQTKRGFNVCAGGTVILKSSDFPFSESIWPFLELGWRF